MFLVLAAGLVGILGAFVLLARRIRRSGVGGGIMGPVDEIYRPAAYHVRQEMQAHEERTIPPTTSHGAVRPNQMRLAVRQLDGVAAKAVRLNDTVAER
jgi:hypothetical protein